jgi:predicted transcriptional regulator
MEWLQQDRVSTALKYYDSLNLDENNVYWYLSGGVKNALETKQTEASKMLTQMKSLGKSNIILDTSATNTAENFRNFNKFIKELESSTKIVIVTSDFHKVRAEKFFYGFFTRENQPEWILSPLECPTCRQDEIYHMRNVVSDIEKAIKTI